jgi:hypothetical protein
LVNLGNFENLKIEADATVEIEDGDDPDDARAEVVLQTRKALLAAYEANRPKKSA